MVQKGEMKFDLNKLYQVEEDKVSLNICEVRYSNVSFIQVTPRDIAIDLLQLPGIKGDDGIQRINGTRVYMTHASAKVLVDVMGKLLEDVHKTGEMETFDKLKKTPKKKGKKKK